MNKIESIHIENFMSIENATIRFDDSNILSLCGYNDSGKSAVIRLIDIMFYNAYTNEQVHYIKDGADYFKCILTFTDGVDYERVKTQTGSSIFILRKDGNTIFDNRKGSQIINTDGVPKVISDYLGVIKDEYTKEELNVRRCTDKLFLIETTGGDNYKILNTILQSDKLAETSTTLNVDKNKLQSEIVMRYNQLSALKDERDRTRVATQQSIDTVEQSVTVLEEMNSKSKGVATLKDLRHTIKSTIIPDEIPIIDLLQVSSLKSMVDTYQTTKQVIPTAIETVDTDRLNHLTCIKSLLSSVNQPISMEVSTVDIDKYLSIIGLKGVAERASLKVPKELEVIDTDRLSVLSTLTSSLQHLKNLDQNLQIISAELNEVEQSLKDFANDNDLTICSNCGAVVSKGGEHAHG